MNNVFFNWSLVLLSAIFDSYAAYVVKTRFNQTGPIRWGSVSEFIQSILVFFKDPIMVSAIICFVAAPGLWFLALNRLDLSVAYPVLVGLHLLLVVLAGAFLLDEAFTLSKAIGTGLVLLSLFFFYSSK
jgi:multidrug transporter EmrE-like cation transporter